MIGILYITWIIIQILIGYHLVLPFVFYIFYILKRPNKTDSINVVNEVTEKDYAIIVTAYEQTTLLPSVVESILKLNYSNYLVYIVADNCDISNLHFENEKVILLKPETVLAGNTRSHFYAISKFKRNHELLTIIDSDNIVHPNYLKELTPFFISGFNAVQGERAAKNLNTTYACLDAARDIYYHFYDCKILFGLGSSATLSGSGMAFTTDLYKECLENLDINGAGFDKVLQAQIVKKDERIAFAGNAIIYDEKTTHSDQLVNQRSRWINTWFKYFGYGFNIVWKGVKNQSSNQFLFGLILLRPPLFLFILASVLCAAINLFILPIFSIVWVIAIGVFILSFYISLRNYPTDERIYRSLINIPKFIYFQMISLVYAKSANKRSTATVHNYHKQMNESDVVDLK
jgi:cellulose synthase/poly-beta-1,6-N-acetylglucosamine synthase-like glycosyltransferase